MTVRSSPGGDSSTFPEAVADLRIFVSPGCLGCDRALAIAALVEQRFPGMTVHVINVDLEPAPPSVIAVPTYMLDGRVISLGNPRDEELFARLEVRHANR